jgi:hypothetical protein
VPAGIFALLWALHGGSGGNHMGLFQIVKKWDDSSASQSPIHNR